MGVDIEITPSVSFELGQENNNTMDATSYGKLTVKLPLGNKQKFTNFAIASKAFKDSRKMDLGALAWVERSNKIMVEKESNIPAFTGGLFRGLTYELVTSPKTGRVWLDRNLGATQVATKVDDSAAYGDYYQWGRAKDGHQSSTSGTVTRSTDIVSGHGHFIHGWADWTDADSSGELRIAAWKDGGKNDICPAGFSVPTEAELTAETTGAKITISTEAASSFLKIPAAGLRNSSGSNAFQNVNDTIFMWVRSARSNSTRSMRLGVFSFSISLYNSDQRSRGLSVRCIRDLIKGTP
ncbi:hypothetical protein BAZOLSSOX_2850 [uncultured Gammaproteobacteria bacterium]|nr:hypothetical protein BAZOLSSOX_2850 [uncultured Gammaproteobacteria bacterium]